MTIIQVSKTQTFFAELSGDRSESSVHTKTTDSSGLFHNLLAGIQNPSPKTDDSATETKANQVFLDEEGKQLEGAMLLGITENQLIIPLDEINEKNVAMLEPNVEEVELSQLSKANKTIQDETQNFAPNPLFAIRSHFEGGEERKKLSFSTPVLSTKQMESLAKWSVNKVGDKSEGILDSTLVLNSEVGSTFETEIRTSNEPELSPIFESDFSSLIDIEGTTVVKTPLNPILETQTTSEPQLTVPLQAPDMPVDIQADGIESVDITNSEFEKFRFEFTKNMMVPLRQAISDGGQTLRIQVFPEHLGHIDIVLSMNDGKMHAQLTASSSITRDVLEMQLPQLRQSLQEQGIQLEQLDIELFGEENLDRERQNYQPNADQNTSKNNRQTDWSDEVAEEIDSESDETSQVVDYSV